MKLRIDAISLFFVVAALFAVPAFVSDKEPQKVECVDDGYGSECIKDLEV